MSAMPQEDWYERYSCTLSERRSHTLPMQGGVLEETPRASMMVTLNNLAPSFLIYI